MQTDKQNVTVYDNGGETLDRYTVCVFDDDDGITYFFGMSQMPFSPLGFNQFCGDSRDGYKEGEHLGAKLDAVPDCIVGAVKDRLW